MFWGIIVASCYISPRRTGCHCEECSDEAIRHFTIVHPMRLLRCARNDILDENLFPRNGMIAPPKCPILQNTTQPSRILSSWT